MQRFATDDVLASVQARIGSLTGEALAGALVELAWHLRQRDTQRALDLATQAEACLPGHASGPTRARLQLVRAESAWLLGDLDAAERWLDQARHDAPGR